MKNPMLRYAAVLGLAAATAPLATAADDNALIDILQRKGVLSAKEANSVREELAHSHGDDASKIKLSSAVSELKLYGDLRMRYQYDEKDLQLNKAQGGGSNVSQRSRWRFRLRLDAEVKLGEHAFAGVELQTNNASDSGNQTFENGFSDYSIFISKAYMGWKANDWLTVTGGKFANPFYTTDLVWDPDINPTGVAEVIAFHKMGEGEPSSGGYSKDGKSVKAVAPQESPWELSLVAGQFIFDDNFEAGGPDHDSSTDAYLFETQLIGSYKFGGVKATFAPGWLIYTAGSTSDLSRTNPFVDNRLVSGSTRNLSILLAPGDISFKLGDLKTKVYWDFAYNIEGDKRAQDTYRLRNIVGNPQHTTEDDFAYLIGVQVGENKKEGDWSLLANWRQTGAAAVDPNLHDDDFALGEVNTRGVKASFAYNFTNYAIGAVTYMYGWNLRDSLFGGELTGGNAIGDLNSFQYIAVDISVKF